MHLIGMHYISKQSEASQEYFILQKFMLHTYFLYAKGNNLFEVNRIINIATRAARHFPAHFSPFSSSWLGVQTLRQKIGLILIGIIDWNNTNRFARQMTRKKMEVS